MYLQQLASPITEKGWEKYIDHNARRTRKQAAMRIPLSTQILFVRQANLCRKSAVLFITMEGTGESQAETTDGTDKPHTLTELTTPHAPTG